MEIIDRIRDVLTRIDAAKKRASRSDEVTLVAVSKRQPEARVTQFIKDYKEEVGSPPTFGENYVQEYRDKKEQLGEHRSHLIGPLQRNKAKDAVSLFDCIESVHSESLLKELEKQAAKVSRSLPVLLQLNISNDQNKSGFVGDDLIPLLEGWKELFPHLLLSGGMTITALYSDKEEARKDFTAFRSRIEDLYTEFSDAFSVNSPQISMGMSADFEVAIEEGATIVRVGSALFGDRPAPT